jgi:hypothetical protein
MQKLRKYILILAAAVVVGFALWTMIALTFAYSTGDRVGYVQKFSKKGWVFKTWEGELAMVNMPGALSEMFLFSVRDDEVAGNIQEHLGKRVRISYEEHVGVPLTWFAETRYYVIAVTPVE